MRKQDGLSSAAQRELKWRERLRRQAGSGLSVRAFCERESIASWAFYQWRARLAKRSGLVERASALARVPAGFIDLSTVDRPTMSAMRGEGARWRAGERVEIKLELGDGVVLQLTKY